MPFACGLRCCVFEGSLAAINAAAPLQPDMVSRVQHKLIRNQSFLTVVADRY
jgi:hypothetical protein